MNPAFPVTRTAEIGDIVQVAFVFSFGAIIGGIGYFIWLRQTRVVVGRLLDQAGVVGMNDKEHEP